MPPKPDTTNLLLSWLCFLGSVLEATVVAAYPEPSVAWVFLLAFAVGAGIFWQRYWAARDEWNAWLATQRKKPEPEAEES